MRDVLESSFAETLTLALRALLKEIWGFEFLYPLEVDPQAGTTEARRLPMSVE